MLTNSAPRSTGTTSSSTSPRHIRLVPRPPPTRLDDQRSPSNRDERISCYGLSRYFGEALHRESITFPYVDSGDEWIDEGVETLLLLGQSVVSRRRSRSRNGGREGHRWSRASVCHVPRAGKCPPETHQSNRHQGLFALTGDPDAFISFISVGDAAEAVVAAIEAPSGTYNVAEADPSTRSQHSMALAKVVGRTRLRSVPHLLQKAGGAGVESLRPITSNQRCATLVGYRLGAETRYTTTWESVQ